MRKLSVLSLALLACGCTTLDTKVTWQQMGNDCVYTEEAGNSSYTITGKRTFDAEVSKTITYPDMQCSKVIEAELKSGVNKNQAVSVSRQSVWWTR